MRHEPHFLYVYNYELGGEKKSEEMVQVQDGRQTDGQTLNQKGR